MSTETTPGSVPEAVEAEHASASSQQIEETPEPQTDGGDGQEKSGRVFTQSELDEIVKKRVAKAEAKAERRVLRTIEQIIPRQQQAQPTAQQDDTRPTRAQFANEDDFVEAMTDWKLHQRDIAARQVQQREMHQTLAQKTEAIYAEAEKLPGFDREAFDELPITKPIAEALIDSDAPAKLMQYLSAHPEDVERIAKLTPARQAAELGKLEARITAAPEAQKKSNAPKPLEQIRSGSSGASTPNPSDSAAWIKYMNDRDKARYIRK